MIKQKLALFVIPALVAMPSARVWAQSASDISGVKGSDTPGLVVPKAAEKTAPAELIAAPVKTHNVTTENVEPLREVQGAAIIQTAGDQSLGAEETFALRHFKRSEPMFGMNPSPAPAAPELGHLTGSASASGAEAAPASINTGAPDAAISPVLQ